MPTLAAKYALVMGSLAMTVATLRSVKDAASPESALWTAIGLMAAFTVVGLTVGWLADTIVVESVRAEAEAELQNIARTATQRTDSSQVP
jgi:undecaprenyl pyrophosphate phosphatase UppP